jgi:hypothetical protein
MEKCAKHKADVTDDVEVSLKESELRDFVDGIPDSDVKKEFDRLDELIENEPVRNLQYQLDTSKMCATNDAISF